jgi:SAM-dependent methyltransferase
MDSIGYYNTYSQAFYDRTIHADLSDIYDRFLPYVPQAGRILDAGCGVGRDSKFFVSQGYQVLPFDGSVEMVRMTSQLLGQTALHLVFENIGFSNEFQAVWANASLLHVPYENLKGILQHFNRALLPSGIFYASFKYGASMRQADERVFFDMNESTIIPYLKGIFTPLEIWKSADTRSQFAASPDRSWLHIIAKAL